MVAVYRRIECSPERQNVPTRRRATMTHVIVMLLLALGAGVCLGLGIAGTAAAIVIRRKRPVAKPLLIGSALAWVGLVALTFAVVWVGATTTYVIRYVN
jgi:hypothetical protein